MWWRAASLLLGTGGWNLTFAHAAATLAESAAMCDLDHVFRNKAGVADDEPTT